MHNFSRQLEIMENGTILELVTDLSFLSYLQDFGEFKSANVLNLKLNELKDIQVLISEQGHIFVYPSG